MEKGTQLGLEDLLAATETLLWMEMPGQCTGLLLRDHQWGCPVGERWELGQLVFKGWKWRVVGSRRGWVLGL